MTDRAFIPDLHWLSLVRAIEDPQIFAGSGDCDIQKLELAKGLISVEQRGWVMLILTSAQTAV